VKRWQAVGLDAGVSYLSKNGVKTLWQSMLKYPAGALQLNNYPVALRKIVPEVWESDGTTKQLAPTDMAAVEIYRDRERGVPRYNAFRKWCAR
jgi:alpha-dioxygenase